MVSGKLRLWPLRPLLPLVDLGLKRASSFSLKAISEETESQLLSQEVVADEEEDVEVREMLEQDTLLRGLFGVSSLDDAEEEDKDAEESAC